MIDANGHLGVAPSSARFKDDVKPMDKASEAILALKPVTFRYKKELEPAGHLHWTHGGGRGKGESRSRRPRQGRQAVHRALRSGERDVAQ